MKEVISSNKNARIKNVVSLLKSKKERMEQDCFVIEGIRLFKDALRSAPQLIKEIYISEDLLNSLTQDAEQYPEGIKSLVGNLDYEVVKTSVFMAMSETVSPQGLIAVVKQPHYTYRDIVREGSLKLLLLEDIQDPGNLGTMIRTAEAAGVNGVIMSRGTADIFNPKVTRSTMGSVFRVPFIYSEDFCATLDELATDRVTSYAAYLHGGVDYNTVSYSDRRGLLIGNEGNGLSEEAVSHAGSRVFIPMAGQVESLNAAVAAALMMFKQ